MDQPDKIFDAMLILECQNGNRKAITLLVNRWHRKLCKQAYWYTKDKAIAKDIAQDSWSIILKKLHGLKDPNVFGSWALTIVTRKSIDWTRKKQKELNHLKSYHESSSAALLDNNSDTPSAIHLHMKNQIKTLPEEQQMVLQLFYFNGHSLQEISKILQKPIGTIKSRLFAARENLKKQLKNINYEE